MLKVSHIIMGQKPIEDGLTIAENCKKYGVGALNIEKCRVGNESITINELEKWSGFGEHDKPDYTPKQSIGRYPGNVVIECTCENPPQNKIIQEKSKAINEKGGYFKKNGSHIPLGPTYKDKCGEHEDGCPCRYINTESGGNSKCFKQINE